MNNDGFDVVNGGMHESRFREYMALFLRGRWVLLSSVVVVVGVMAVYTWKTKPLYEATSMVLINTKGTKGPLQVSDVVAGGATNKIANELVILKTRSMAEAAAQALLADPYLDASKKETLPILALKWDGPTDGKLASVQQVTGRVRVSMEFVPERDADIIKLTAKSTNPKEAAILANKYAEAYQEEIMNSSRARSKSVREFLENRLKEQSGSLAKAETSLKGFMESAGVVTLDGQSNRVVQELAQLEATRNALDIDLQTLGKRIESYQKQLPQQEANLASAIGQANDPYIRMLQEQLAKLEVQRDVIIAQNDPEVLKQDLYAQKLRDINDQVKALRGQLQKRSNEFIKSVLPGDESTAQADPLGYFRTVRQKALEAKLEMESLRTRREALQNIIRQYDKKFQAIPRESMELAKHQRERLSSEKLYLLVEERYNEATISEKSEFGYVDIIDRAVPPYSPVSPNMQNNLILGIVIGLGLGVGIVLLRDVLDVRVRTPEDLKRRGYVALCEVAPMDHELHRLRADNKLPPEVRRFDEHLWLSFDSLSFLSESYRRLRTNILHVHMARPLKTIMLTSPNPYEGKTTTICNLAISFAETQKRVLLVDADLRRPTVHSKFGIAPEYGLADLLTGNATFEQVVQRNVVENLDIVCCGTILRNLASVLGSRSMQTFLDQMKKQYTWILVDTPPILIVNDAAVLSTIIDGTILVVSSGSTRVATMERAVEFLQGAGGGMIGAVLNRFDAQRVYGRYYGSYRYGHYGSGHDYYSPSNGKGTHKASRLT